MIGPRPISNFHKNCATQSMMTITWETLYSLCCIYCNATLFACTWAWAYAYVRVRACVRACVFACVSACIRALSE